MSGLGVDDWGRAKGFLCRVLIELLVFFSLVSGSSYNDEKFMKRSGCIFLAWFEEYENFAIV